MVFRKDVIEKKRREKEKKKAKKRAPVPELEPDIQQGILFEGLEEDDCPAPGGQDPERYWEKEYRKAKAKLAQIELKVKKGELAPVADRDRLLAVRALEFRRGLEDALLNFLPPKLAAIQEPVEIAEIFEDLIKQLMDRYSRKVHD